MNNFLAENSTARKISARLRFFHVKDIDSYGCQYPYDGNHEEKDIWNYPQ
jgi:hypothetical protein